MASAEAALPAVADIAFPACLRLTHRVHKTAPSWRLRRSARRRGGGSGGRRPARGSRGRRLGGSGRSGGGISCGCAGWRRGGGGDGACPHCSAVLTQASKHRGSDNFEAELAILCGCIAAPSSRGWPSLAPYAVLYPPSSRSTLGLACRHHTSAQHGIESVDTDRMRRCPPRGALNADGRWSRTRCRRRGRSSCTTTVLAATTRRPRTLLIADPSH